MNRSDILNFFVENYFDNDEQVAANLTEYDIERIKRWRTGEIQPQKDSLDYVIHCALAPEFRVIVEYEPFDPNPKRRERTQQVAEMLGDHNNGRGIYAFYDSSANLLYIGKTDVGLQDEIMSALDRKLYAHVALLRWNIVRYISAYSVSGGSSFDYPKHVESLMLRISRPRLNSNIGKLEKLPR